MQIRSQISNITPARLLAVLALMTALSNAQVTKPSTPETTTPLTDDKVIVLSPFIVNAETDNGYQARSTLLGSRLNTSLRDIASPVTVMTKEFLADVGAVTLDEALRYSINVENTGEFISATSNGGDFNQGIINNYQANRSRGLTTAGRTHDLFNTSLFPDTYNIERITIASGPNSILFGLGNSSGTIDVTFKHANLDRETNEIQLRTDDNNSLRTSVDFNIPIFKKKLAIRLAGVAGNEHTFRQPDFDKNKRIFGALTYVPFKNTTIRGWFEHAEVDRQPARNTSIYDGVTPWINAGKPTFNNGIGATFPTATNPLFARNTSVSNVYIFGATTGSVPPIEPWLNTVVSAGPEKLLPSPDNIPQSLADPTIFPNDINLNGNGTRNFTNARIFGLSLEQQVGENLFIEAAYNDERIRNPFSDLVRGLDSTLQVDANQFLPDQVTPNPNLGHYYVQGSGRAGLWILGQREARLTATYQLDLTKKNKWLGRHRLAALLSESRSYNAMQDTSPKIINNDATFGDPNANLTNTTTRPLRFRMYLSNPQDSTSGSSYTFNYPPGDPFANTTLPGGIQIASINNPYGATGVATLTNAAVDTKLASIQSYWWQDRIVTLFGWREDRVRQATMATPRIGTGSNTSPFALITDLGDYHSNWSFWNTGRTAFKSVVVHPLNWLSVYYSKSGTYAPNLSSHNPDGTLVAGSKGAGVDYGITVDLWENKLSLKVNHFNDSVGPDASSYRALVRDPVDQIEDTVAALGGNTNTGGYDSTQAQAYWEVVSNHVAKGYEIELTANPTKNWRMLLTATKTESVESDIGAPWITYVQSRLSAWAPFASSPLVANPNKTVSQRLGDMIVAINTMKQADGAATEQTRKYRINFTNRYSFNQGKLKGFFAGGVYQWRSRAALGYQIQSLPNDFPFPGLGTTVNVPDLSKPLYDGPITTFDAFAGYKHKLFRNRIEWTVQLNIRNALNSDKIIVQQLLSTGAVDKFTIQAPRSFILTNTFSF